jgi:hypothetical protein
MADETLSPLNQWTVGEDRLVRCDTVLRTLVAVRSQDSGNVVLVEDAAGVIKWRASLPPDIARAFAQAILAAADAPPAG